MKASSSSRKGWCPGALRPMPAGDGLLLRLRPPNNVLLLDAAQEIATCAAQHGNGQIELSSRGNLQMRGLMPQSVPEIQVRLKQLGLLDATAEAEAIRNIQISPLAGLTEASDIRPLAQNLAQALAEAPDLYQLPAKFGFLIDDGSLPSLADCPADVRFDYQTATNCFSIGIGGTAASATRLDSCASEDVVPLALSLARTFLMLSGSLAEAPRRMHALLDEIGAPAFAQAAGLFLTAPISSITPKTLPIGPDDRNGLAFLGAGAPFGRLSHGMLAGLAAAAHQAGVKALRLTPWRLFLLAGFPADRLAQLTKTLSRLGFILDPEDPRLAVVACAGAPACAEATTPVQSDAAALASLIRHQAASGPELHLSGCAKGCAHPTSTPFTLVAKNGLYDLIIKGTSKSRPEQRALTIEAARQVLARYLSTPTGACV
ncbi:precorrin-3B synthase [Beijerinckia indica]|uniref:Precorrin-3B synthase n=1 Tax=Beijerinckia indica subsp. indica (strain ATCC 9039 / DSM 1715 / NCIMB 8712) TaxID=395963 RepID=B2IFG5_BEII9|nr:precorrin-3B synthase [Beijerinckia indica]ACB97065.1 precorrin-3B synthase [Beijerinckia indica subsp. indica ATCC 9039]